MEDNFQKKLRNYCGQETPPNSIEREIWTTLSYDMSVGTKL